MSELDLSLAQAYVAIADKAAAAVEAGGTELGIWLGMHEETLLAIFDDLTAPSPGITDFDADRLGYRGTS